MQELKRYSFPDGELSVPMFPPRVWRQYVLYTDAVEMQRRAFMEGADWSVVEDYGDMGISESCQKVKAEAARRYKEEA